MRRKKIFTRNWKRISINDNEFLNSASSQLSSSQEDKHPHSYNNINPNYIHNYINGIGNQNVNNSIDFNYEERMETIRKKCGNSLVIKCFLKKQIEEFNIPKI